MAEKLKLSVEAYRQKRSATQPLELARNLTGALFAGGLDQAEDLAAYECLVSVNQRGILHRANEQGCFWVTVEKGDSLSAICTRLKREGHPLYQAGLIQLFNAIKTEAVHPGQRL